MPELPHLDVSKLWSLEDVVRTSHFEVRLRLEDKDRARLDACRKKAIDALDDPQKRLYGFNTGFGDNRTGPTVPPGLRGVIQDNLILSHCAGFGEPVAPEVVR